MDRDGDLEKGSRLYSQCFWEPRRKRYLETNRASDPETELEEKGDQDLKRSKMGSETLGKTLRETGDCGELSSPLDGSP